MSNNKCDKPCGTCPWLKQNHNKPNPANLEQLKQDQPDFDWEDWYSEKNLARLWKGTVKTATPMVCHSHDPNASTYGGKDAKVIEPKLCVGQLIAVFKHIKYQEKLLNKGISGKNLHTLYKQKAGKYPMKKDEVGAWVMMFAMGRADFGGQPFPRVIDGDSAKQVAVHWKDEIINEAD
jgi:hypothetical protein